MPIDFSLKLYVFYHQSTIDLQFTSKIKVCCITIAPSINEIITFIFLELAILIIVICNLMIIFSLVFLKFEWVECVTNMTRFNDISKDIITEISCVNELSYGTRHGIALLTYIISIPLILLVYEHDWCSAAR